jgi:hypothetical protein
MSDARFILWALPKGATDRLHERPLTSMPLTATDVARVKTAAAADGWHGFRTTTEDGSVPDFAAAIRGGK